MVSISQGKPAPGSLPDYFLCEVALERPESRATLHPHPRSDRDGGPASDSCEVARFSGRSIYFLCEVELTPRALVGRSPALCPDRSPSDIGTHESRNFGLTDRPLPVINIQYWFSNSWSPRSGDAGGRRATSLQLRRVVQTACAENPNVCWVRGVLDDLVAQKRWALLRAAGAALPSFSATSEARACAPE